MYKNWAINLRKEDAQSFGDSLLLKTTLEVQVFIAIKPQKGKIISQYSVIIIITEYWLIPGHL